MLENVVESVKYRIIRKIILVLLPIVGNIALIFLIVMLIQAPLAAIRDLFTGWINGKETTFPDESSAITEWIKQVDEKQLIKETGLNKETLLTFLAVEEKTYLQDIDIVTVHGEEYTLPLKNATYKYRFPWQVLTVLTSMQEGASNVDINNKVVNEIFNNLKTKYYGLTTDGRMIEPENIKYINPEEFAFNKVVKTEYKTTVVTTDSEGNTHVSTDYRVVEEKYPLPYFTQIITYINKYNFEYTTTSETYTNTVTDSYESDDGSSTSIATDIITTTTIPVLSNIQTESNISMFFNSIKPYYITVKDLDMIIETLKELPYGEDIAYQILEAAADYDGGIVPTPSGVEVPPGQAIQFNFIYPTLSGRQTRQDIVNVGKSILGLTYFWGGKYPKQGFNPEWGKLKTVTSPNYWGTGQKHPYGLDCSGFVQWVYVQVFGEEFASKIGVGSVQQWSKTYEIKESELKPGDLGFYKKGGGVHVGIFIGRDSDGTPMFIHCAGRQFKDASRPYGQVIISKNFKSYNGYPGTKFRYFRRVKVNFGDD